MSFLSEQLPWHLPFPGVTDLIGLSSLTAYGQNFASEHWVKFSTILHNLFFPPRLCHVENSALFIFYLLPIFLTTNLKHSRSSGYFLLIRNTVYSCIQITLFACHRGATIGGQRFLLLILKTWEPPWLIFRFDASLAESLSCTS